MLNLINLIILIILKILLPVTGVDVTNKVL
jgi:hypothetical protein